MQNTLLPKINAHIVKNTLKSLGYPVFTKGDYNLNIGVIRSENRVADSFDDVIYCLCNIDGKEKFWAWSATADPGEYYLYNLMDAGGAAIVCEGFYKSVYQLGSFHSKPALLQVGPFRIYRDKDKNNILTLDPRTITEGYYGILVHYHFQGIEEAQRVYNSSAGCNVFQKNKDGDEFFRITNKAVSIWGNSLSWAVLGEKQLVF